MKKSLLSRIKRVEQQARGDDSWAVETVRQFHETIGPVVSKILGEMHEMPSAEEINKESMELSCKYPSYQAYVEALKHERLSPELAVIIEEVLGRRSSDLSRRP